MRNSTGFLLFLALALVGCGSFGGETPQAAALYPTPTTSILFSAGQPGGVQSASTGQDTGARPTIASFFAEPQALPTAKPQPTVISAEFVASPTVTPTLEISETIFDDTLSRNWRVLKYKSMQVDFENHSVVYSGQSSAAITPAEDFSSLIFSVNPDSGAVYLREQVLGISFYLNSGDSYISTSDLAVTVLGSNAYPYWVAGDNSVENTADPVFPETRLYYLDVNRSIPPQTWVEIVVWLDDLVYDPIYQYVTGFSIKNDAGFTQTFYIDRVTIIQMAE